MNFVDTNDRERFIRWQGILRDQVSFLNNLLLTISIGIVGFCISLLSQENFNLINCTKFLFTLGLGIVFISIFLGLLAAGNRLKDFRETVKKIKNNTKDSSRSKPDEKKQSIAFYGKITWCLLYWQIGTFSFGVFFFVTCVHWNLL